MFEKFQVVFKVSSFVGNPVPKVDQNLKKYN